MHAAESLTDTTWWRRSQCSCFLGERGLVQSRSRTASDKEQIHTETRRSASADKGLSESYSCTCSTDQLEHAVLGQQQILGLDVAERAHSVDSNRMSELTAIATSGMQRYHSCQYEPMDDVVRMDELQRLE